VHYFWHIVFGLPFSDLSYWSFKAVRNARKIVKKYNIDLFEVQTAHLAFFKYFFPNTPTLVVYHNIESDLFPFWINASGFFKWLLEFVAKFSRRSAQKVEFDNVWNVEQIAFISLEDMARVNHPNKHYVPLCLPIQAVNYEKKPANKCVFLWMGSADWYPNLEAINWLATEIIPRLERDIERLGIEFRFLGHNLPPELQALHDGKHIFVHGFVPDVRPFLEMAHVSLAPFKSGGGVRIKVLESLSYGIPVLGTRKGLQGVPVENNVHAIIRDEIDEYCQAIKELALNPILRSSLSRNSIAFLREHYDRTRALETKKKIYEALSSRLDI
jgi:glycosyltransferase involved in cell wall biosynthesis